MFCCAQAKPQKNGLDKDKFDDRDKLEIQEERDDNSLSHNKKVSEANQIQQNTPVKSEKLNEAPAEVSSNLKEQSPVKQSKQNLFFDLCTLEINDERILTRGVPHINKFLNPFKDLLMDLPHKELQTQKFHHKSVGSAKEIQIKNEKDPPERALSASPKEPLLQLEKQDENLQMKCSQLKVEDPPSLEEIQIVQESLQHLEAFNDQEDNDDDNDREFTEEEAKHAALYRWAKEDYPYCTDKTLDEIMKRVNSFTYLKKTDEARTDAANKDGGKQCQNKRMVKTIRAIGRQILKEIGKKVLSGNFNLSTISFPIRAMIPKSALEKALQTTCLFPLYINRAAMLKDPVERMKFVICATIGNFYINCSFLKPLNPILGETIEARYPDGTQLYAEQILHHPPVSYFLVLGPNKSYKFYGYYNYEAHAGLNSLSLKNRGKRYIQFKDGQLIEYNFASEEYQGSFWGAMKLEAHGKMIFTDKVNSIVAEMTFDNVRWKPTDYFQGDIRKDGHRVSKIYGSYMGFIQFDEVRYWDYRDIQPYQFMLVAPSPLLGSDHQYRLDRKCLLKKKVDEAQQEKQNLENLQRTDAKLRKEFAQRR